MSIDDYSDIFDKAAKQYSVDPELLRAVATTESSGNPSAVSPAGAKGIMQLMPATAKSLGADPLKPAEAIPAAARLLRQHLDHFKDPEKALMAYNAGPNTAHWDNPETKQYPGKVFKNYKGTQQVVNNDQDDIEKLLSAPDEQVVAKSAPEHDDIEALLSAPDEPTPPPKPPLPPKDGAILDTLKTIPSSVVKGIGAIPQIPAMAGNAIANAEGWTAGKLSGANPQQMEKLSNINPFFTGNTPIDALDQAGKAIVTGDPGKANPLTESVIHQPQTGLGRFTDAAIQGGIAGPAAGARLVPSVIGAATGELGSEAFPGNPVAPLIAGGVGYGAANLGAQAFKPTPVDPNQPVNKFLNQKIQDSGLTPAELQNKLASMGPDATLADVSENLRGATEGLGNLPGPAREAIQEQLEERHAGQIDRLTDAATQGLGVPPGASARATTEKLIEDRATAAAPIYEEAFKANKSITSPEIDRILQTPSGKEALKAAVRTMQDGSKLVGVSDPDLVEQHALTGGEPTGDGISGGLKLETLDLVKQHLWDVAESKMKTENGTSRDTTASRNIKTQWAKFVNELDNADTTIVRDKKGDIVTPGKYKQARDAYSNPSQSIDAVEAGKDFFKNGAEVNLDAVKNLAPQDKPFFRIGVAQKLADILQNTPDGADAVKRIFNTRGKRAALESVFPDKASFDNFTKTVDNEREFVKTYQAVKANSVTARRTANMQDVQNGLQKGVQGGVSLARHGIELAQRNPVGQAIYTVGELGKAAYNKLTAAKPTPEDQAMLTAKYLLTPNSQRVGSAIPPAPAHNSLVRSYIDHLSRNAGYAPIFLPAAEKQPEDNSK